MLSYDKYSELRENKQIITLILSNGFRYTGIIKDLEYDGLNKYKSIILYFEDQKIGQVRVNSSQIISIELQKGVFNAKWKQQ